MPLVTLFQAKDHCHSDDNDDAAVQRCVNAAEALVARMANRNFYASQDDLDDALAGISASMTAANAAYLAAMDAASGLDTLDRLWAEDVARKNLRDATTAASMAINGLIVSDDIIAAILLVTGHLYANREEVLAGANAAAVQIPMGAQRIIEAHRALGPL